MKQTSRIAIVLFVSLIAGLASAETRQITTTGWFSDDRCALPRGKSGTYTATNSECARRCVKEGAKLVFIADQEKAVWMLNASDRFAEDIGYYVRVKASLDDKGVATIKSVERLEEVHPSCSIPKEDAKAKQ